MSRGVPRAAGERIGPFQIERFLASGGMGDVYVARDTATGEPVALKFLADASPANVQRFEREGRIAASLNHPHVVRGRGVGRTPDGVVYIAMELLSGEDLDTRMNTAGVTAAEAVTVAMQVCDALEHAHARRIVHRDLKPQNIFLCAGETLHAKVLDFGVARLADERRLTGTGMMVGTWSHMSPEQARAETDLDERSDIWSLGVVLYECFCARLPFDAPTAPSTLYHILFESPPDLAKLAPHLPRALTDTVHKTLAKSREDRPPTAAALRAMLAQIDLAQLSPLRVKPVSHSQRPPSISGDEGTIDASAVSATMYGEAAAATVENRLTSAVFLRAVRERALVEDVAQQLKGRLVALGGDDLLVVFGTDRWNGDEPDRAVRLGVAVAATAQGVGIATGRVIRGASQVTGAAVDAAVALSHEESVTLDATTASVVRARYALQTRDDGSARVDLRAMRSSSPGTEAAFATSFLGRDLELTMLAGSVEQAQDDRQPNGVVVLGAAGMGKSRLRHEALQEVLKRSPDATCLLARCEAFRRDAPFAPLADALGDFVDDSIRGVFAAVSQAQGDPVAALDRARGSFEALLRGIATRGPVVLAIDDVQWLDASSQAAIRWVCEHATDLPLSIWLFGRLEARESATSVVVGANVLELKPLGKAHSERLLREITGKAPEAVLERAGGHPLFIEELGRLYARRGELSLTSATGTLPVSIEGAHLAQIDQLDLNDKEFLKRSSVFGRAAWVEAVASLGGDAASLERLRKINLLVTRPRSRFEPFREFAFRVGLLQEVAYGLFTDEQRARLHERAAEWLAQREGVFAEELARHWDLGGDATRAAEAYTRAAEASAHVSDAATTSAHADRALELTDDVGLRWRAIVARDDSLQLAGDRAVQRKGIDELRALAPTLGREAEAEAAYRACYFARMTNDAEAARGYGRQAIELADQSAASRWGSAAHNELALLYADEGRFGEAISHAASARKLANKTGDAWLVARSLNTQAYVMVESGRPVEALEVYELSAARYSRAGDRRREALVLANTASVLMDLGRLDEAAARLTGAIDASKRVGNARTIAAATHNLGTVRRTQGDLKAARAHQAFAREEAERLRYTRLAASVAVEEVYLAIQTGDVSEALVASAERAESLAGQSRSPGLIASARAVGLRARARAGADVASAVAEARAVAASVTGMHAIALDVHAALYEVGGRAQEDLEAAHSALGALLATLDPEDQRACTETLARRNLLPEEVLQRA